MFRRMTGEMMDNPVESPRHRCPLVLALQALDTTAGKTQTSFLSMTIPIPLLRQTLAVAMLGTCALGLSVQADSLVDNINPFIGSSTSVKYGEPLNRAWLHHSEIAAGGALELVMGPTPNDAWRSAPDELPPKNFPSSH